ncbi:hypothetical protein QZM15_16270 [Burkholderia sp. AU44665]|uniref:hypothetical protein n=1 Tax=Burkholderia sp. AU44665 TaxID=3059203 RepID=UPI00265ECB6C|nr:hypothetical protein [Burkholderia sp. AU44665]MDN7700027.1 hypothetical protein [Burkholderia sp. AU44665]
MKVIVTVHDAKKTAEQEFEADSWSADSSLRLYKGEKLIAEFANYVWVSVRVA